MDENTPQKMQYEIQQMLKLLDATGSDIPPEASDVAHRCMKPVMLWSRAIVSRASLL